MRSIIPAREGLASTDDDLTTPRLRLRPPGCPAGGYAGFTRLLRHRDEPQFRLDLADQYEVSIAMQKRHLTVDSVHGDQAISGGSWRYASPSAPGVEVSRGTRSRRGVGLHQHGQFARYPIPTRQPFRTLSPLQYLF